MDYGVIAARLGEEFVSTPFELVTKTNLQVRLDQLLEEELDRQGTLYA